MIPRLKQVILGSSNKAIFNNSLKTSLIPTIAANGTPTFTRASAATVVDFEGLVKTVKSGEARFYGARRVENFVPQSNDITGAGWTTLTGVTRTANTLTDDNTTGVHRVGTSSTTIPSQRVTARVKLKSNNVTLSRVVILVAGGQGKGFDLNTGTVFNPGSGETIATEYAMSALQSDGSYICVVSSNSETTSASIQVRMADATGVTNYTGSSTNSVIISEVQLETYTNGVPSEYVSSGVLSAPYHGANVDGVKYFDYQNGNTVSSNVVTEARGADIADSTLRGYLAEEQRINLWLSSGDISNATYWTKDNTNDTISNNVITESATGGNTYHGVVIPSGQRPTLTLNTNYTASFLFTTGGTRRYVVVGSGGGGDGFGVTVDTQNWTITETATGASAGAYVSSSIKQLSSTTYLVTVTGKHTTTTGATAIIRGTTGATGNGAVGLQYTGDGSTIKVSNIQIELGSMATSYIPTTTATVTRSADVLNYPAANINNASGVATMEVQYNWSGNPAIVSYLLGKGSGTDGGLSVSTTDLPTAVRIHDGTNGTVRSSLGDDPTTAICKRGGMWGGSGKSAGGNATISTTPGSFDGDMDFVTMNIGHINSARFLNGTIRNVNIYKKEMKSTKFKDLL